MLVVPPTINKFYAVDLAPGRSLVEYLVQQGQQVFMISWRNPNARHADWGLATYVKSVIEALDAVERITGTEHSLLTAICSGGIIASCTAAVLAGRGQLGRLAGCTLLVTVLDNRKAGDATAITDRTLATAAKALSRRKGYLDGRQLAEVFAWLRPGDLVWNYVVNNYLLGKRPPAFDILFWNADTTRMAAQLHADFVDIALDNPLIEPGALVVDAIPVDLTRVDIDSYVVAGVTDHITPWQNCYRTVSMLGGSTRFVLSVSGHIAALVNPPSNPKATFQLNPKNRPTRRTGSKEPVPNPVRGGRTGRVGWASTAAPSSRRPPSLVATASHPSQTRREPTSSTSRRTTCLQTSADRGRLITSTSPTS
jgi:polyhydroxyalkanoate synthase